MAYTPAEERYLEAVKTQEFGPVLGDLQAPNWQAQYPNFSWSWPTGKTNPRVIDKTTGQVLQTGAQASGDFGFEKYVLPVLAGGVGAGAAGLWGGGAGAGAAEGAIAPWGAREAVSGAYPGVGAGATAGGAGAALPDAGMDFGMYNPGQANPYVTGASGADAAAATNTAAAAGGGAGTPSAATGTAVAGGSAAAIGRILAGNGTAADYATVIGAAAPAALGAYASSQQTGALKDLAGKYMEMGAPYRDKLAALYANPSSFLTSPEVTTPVQQGTDALARSLSTRGNPIGSGHALQELQNYSSNQLFSRLGEEKNRLAGFGGLSAYNAAAPGAATSAIGSQANIYNAIGGGIYDVMNPRSNLVDLMRQVRGLA